MDIGSIFLYVVGSIIAIALVVIFISAGIDAIRTYKLLKQTRTGEIGSVGSGLAKLKGKVIPLNALTSPLGNTDCVYYKFKVEYYARRKRRYEWITALEETKASPFLVDDGTGRLFIDPEGLGMDVSWELTTETKMEVESKDLPESAVKFLKRHDLTGRNLYRLKETILKGGSVVSILGVVEPATGKDYKVSIVANRKNEPCCVISDMDEAALRRSKIIQGVGLLVFGVAIAVIALIVLYNKIATRFLPH